MRQESRIKKSLLNARVNLVCYFVALVVAFYSRKVFFNFLGAEFLGLAGTITGFLGFFNLAESGVGMAIAYLLYKPIYDGDKDRINELISVFGYLYHLIGFIILGVSFLFSLFLPFIFPNTSFSWGVIYFAYYAAVITSLLGYFVNYPQILLTADQRNYEVTGFYQIVTVLQTLVQILFIYIVNSFYVFIGLQILFGFAYSFVLYWRINKVYPWLKSDVRLGHQLFKKYPGIITYVKQIFIHKIGGYSHYQLIPVLIYSYVSLPVVALYNNYQLIGGKLNAIVNAVLGSTNAGVGNLIAEGDKKKILSVYEQLFAIDTIAAGMIGACIYKLSSPFISLWLGEQYVLDDIVVFLISLEFFLGILRLSTDQFIQGSGLFSDVWSPIVEVLILIITSVFLGSHWGLSGILSGPIISCILLIYVWKPYFLFKNSFKLPVSYYWLVFFKNIAGFVLAYFVASYLTDCIKEMLGIIEINWMNWIMYSLLFSILLIIFLICSISLASRDFRSLLLASVQVLKNKLVK